MKPPPGPRSNRKNGPPAGDAINNALATTAAISSASSNGVALIDTSGISDPVMLMLADKINELITAQRR